MLKYLAGFWQVGLKLCIVGSLASLVFIQKVTFIFFFYLMMTWFWGVNLFLLFCFFSCAEILFITYVYLLQWYFSEKTIPYSCWQEDETLSVGVRYTGVSSLLGLFLHLLPMLKCSYIYTFTRWLCKYSQVHQIRLFLDSIFSSLHIQIWMPSMMQPFRFTWSAWGMSIFFKRMRNQVNSVEPLFINPQQHNEQKKVVGGAGGYWSVVFLREEQGLR